jgi:hypothetical protein
LGRRKGDEREKSQGIPVRFRLTTNHCQPQSGSDAAHFASRRRWCISGVNGYQRFSLRRGSFYQNNHCFQLFMLNGTAARTGNLKLLSA